MIGLVLLHFEGVLLALCIVDVWIQQRERLQVEQYRVILFSIYILVQNMKKFTSILILVNHGQCKTAGGPH